jgi:hypothetical protein
MAEESNGELVAHVRRPRELELDLLLAHELASGSPAAVLLWKQVGLPTPAMVTVALQVARTGDGRTSDVVGEGAGVKLVCEDKLADGIEQVGQLEGLAAERNLTGCKAAVVAPRRYLDRRADTLRALDLPGIAVEDLAAALEAAAPADGELGRSYAFRIRALRDICVPRVATVSEPGTAFRHAYNAHLAEDSAGQVALEAGTLTQGGTFAEFQSGCPLPAAIRSATHKLSYGILDVTPPTGWTLEALTTFLGHLRSADSIPDGWMPAVPKMARRTKETGQPSPVLRHSAPVGPANLTTMTTEEAASAGWAAAEGVAHALQQLAAWLTRDEPGLVLASPQNALAHLLEAARSLAADLGRTEQSAAIAQLLSAPDEATSEQS